MHLPSLRRVSGVCAGLLLLTGAAPAADTTIATDPAKGDKREQELSERRSGGSADRTSVDELIAAWPDRPRLGAVSMIAKYGQPQEATAERLIWRDQGPYKRITVTREEHAHDFPMPHTDFLEHTIAYAVPADKADELAKFDGSLTYDRTRGEMSARCDLEGHNILTLNLANDVVTGKQKADDARKKFGEIVVQDTLGKKPEYVMALQFKPADQSAMFSDKPVIPGSAMRADQAAQEKAGKDGGDGEILGQLIALDLSEVIAAMAAKEQQELDPRVIEYADMLHREHGEHAEKTMKLGKKIDVTPLETKAVDEQRAMAAGELAKVVPLTGESFATAYLAMMVKGHQQALQMIDTQLLPMANKDEVKQYLAETRTHLEHHLKQAQDLQAGMKR